MKTNFLLISICIFTLVSCKKEKDKSSDLLVKATNKEIKVDAPKKAEIFPIEHASTVIKYKDKTIFLDPTLGAKPYKNYGNPDFVVVTDIHGDHLNFETLKALDLSKAVIIAPKAVQEKILQNGITTEIIVMNNGDVKTTDTFTIEAIPMYNLREEALKFHSKGRGNGYVFTFGKERVYFSGDTEDIPEMRNLKNIDRAFVCMNLPYTMTVESAVSAVLDFKPKEVLPYHYRGTNGFSDVEKFKTMINEGNPDIKVTLLNWYSEK
ncbi:MBL fold metallo-hydrolase [Neotamlana laminarinivorans]|uniref:MBL fold metallo-hydrolase n=1 Tax=Neotamlana laminarinivorans TaxID=2883124 RepID=A0A9X1L0A3_9FLAO|nr:MBL fold metallo-hydrolase [Tamlana laminarinivorans]MCB4797593.1 MBL fold metallo-hydrolase [Tamlana laminarinivorans]